jgi:co-chaperonin GroES (HSP10)
MPETIKIELTRKQLDEGILPINHVLVEMTHNNDYKATKSGIVIGLPDRSTYDANALGADMQEIWGIVYRTPLKLFFDEKDSDSMDWDCDMEVEKGDVAYFGLIDSANCHEVVCEDRLYKIIPYQELYVTKRGKDIIPLNGYILCQTVNMKKISELDVLSEDKIDKTKAIVRFVGTPNKRYKTKSYADHLDLQPGDEVLLEPRTPFLFLERKTQFATFDGDNLYIVVQRKKVAMVIKRANG